MKIEVLGANVPRANESIIQALINANLIHIGEDNQLHVTEQRKSTTNLEPTKAD